MLRGRFSPESALKRLLGLGRVCAVGEGNDGFVIASNYGCHHADGSKQQRVGHEDSVKDVDTPSWLNVLCYKKEN
jgi:hypothetical protein